MADQTIPRHLEIGFGTNLASTLTAELIARTGFDWIWLDYEPGPWTETTLLDQLPAVSGRDMLTIVRVAWNDAVRVKRALERVAQACRDNGKRSGTLVPEMARLEKVIDLGYRFLAIESYGGLLAGAMREALTRGRSADPRNAAE